MIGDFVKGSIPKAWPKPLRAGVALHRKIDALSNVHPHIHSTCRAYPAHLRRYAPIFLDLLVDFSLARNWSKFYDHAITVVSADCYHALTNNSVRLPQRGHRLLTYMQDVDLLANYDDWHHIEQGLKSVLRRLQVELNVEEVIATCAAQVTPTDRLLDLLYADLRSVSTEWNAFNAIATA